MKLLTPIVGLASGLPLLLGALATVDWTYPELAYRPDVIPMVAGGVGIVLVGLAWNSAWRKAALPDETAMSAENITISLANAICGLNGSCKGIVGLVPMTYFKEM